MKLTQPNDKTAMTDVYVVKKGIQIPLIGVRTLKDIHIIDQCWSKVCKKIKELNLAKEEDYCKCIPRKETAKLGKETWRKEIPR